MNMNGNNWLKCIYLQTKKVPWDNNKIKTTFGVPSNQDKTVPL